MNHTILEKVCRIAVETGTFQAEQRKNFSLDSVQAKKSHDYVSYVDKESEKMIVAGLKEILPEAGFITEEKTTEQITETTEYVWIVDPLDGTTNFIHDLGPWNVSIALQQNGELVMGVVYEVARKELFYASKGNGAWLKTSDGATTPLHVSATNDIDQALVAIGYPYNAEEFRELCIALSNRLYGHCASIRSLGSAETELCYVAAGRLDIYVESFLQPWDVSAGAAILKEAGGRISDYAGTDRLWKSGREVLATNALLHEEMRTHLSSSTPL